MKPMTDKGYTSQVESDAEDKIIVGRVIDTDGSITFQGASMLALAAATQTAIDGAICACEQLGQAAEKPVSGRLMLRVDLPSMPPPSKTAHAAVKA